MAVQYAVAMGLNVAAVDVDDAKLDLARRLGAKVTVNAEPRRTRRRRSSAKPAAGRRAHW